MTPDAKDVIDKARALVARLDEMFIGPHTREQMETLRAALASLDAAERGAGRGEKCPRCGSATRDRVQVTPDSEGAFSPCYPSWHPWHDAPSDDDRRGGI